VRKGARGWVYVSQSVLSQSGIFIPSSHKSLSDLGVSSQEFSCFAFVGFSSFEVISFLVPF
jgi:hypothetical protein